MISGRQAAAVGVRTGAEPAPTTLDPPLIGRDRELAAARAAVEARGCVICGASGVGRSRLALEVASAFAADGVIHVLATASAAELPFGAFGHVIGASHGRSAAAIGRYVAALRARYGERRPTFVVDDAHLLDGGSAALVLALAATDAARLVVTIRTPEGAPDAVTALWKEHGLERVELAPLHHRDARLFVESLLGDPVHARAHERIHELSQGNPLVIRELVRDALDSGALQLADGRWRWRADLVSFARSRVLVQRRTRGVSQRARRTLELVALGAPLPLAVACELSSASAVEELERAGLVEVQGAGQAADVRLTHPLDGEVLVARLPATTAMRLRRSLGLALQRSADLDDAGRLRVALWLLDAGEAAPDLFTRASSLAVARGDAALALRLATAAGDRLDATVAASVALNALARFGLAEAVLAPSEPAAAGADEAASGAYVAARVEASLRGGLAEPVEDGLLDRAAGWHAGPAWDALIATLRGWVELYRSRPGSALARVAPLLADESLPALPRFYAHAVAIGAQSRLGLIDRCGDTAASARAVVARLDPAPRLARYATLMFELLPRVHAARDLALVETRLRAATTEAVTRHDQPLRATATMGLGMLALRRGHISAAVALLEEAADSLTGADPVNSELLSLTSLACARALGGDPARATRALRQAEAVALAHPRLAHRLTPELEYARSLVDAALGRISAAIERLIASALAGHEAPAAELEALYMALRLGADPRLVVAPLRARAARVEIDVAAVYVRHAEALAEGDGAAQLEAARALAGYGLDLCAAEAAGRAALAYRDAARSSSSREAAALAAKYAARCEGAVTPALVAAPAAARLTPRELEIANLAARGMANRAIADALTISVRTVESCVLRACRKVGVDNRRALAELLGDVEEPALDELR